ncbi:MAG: M12 family metallo-peptidase [Rhodocyclaceae bacterium]|nr:M12 family metallo-peptidase [Rhodocyclaceae bacterium]
MSISLSAQPPATIGRRARLACALSLAFLAVSASAAAATTSNLFSSAEIEPGVAAGKHLYQVTLDASALETAKPGQLMHLSLPGLGSHEVVFDGRLRQGDAVKWMGHLKQGVQYGVVLLLSSEGATGSIRTPAGLFELGHANGKQWLADRGVADVSKTLAGMPAMFHAVALGATPSGATGAGKPAKAAYPVRYDTVRMASLKAGDEVALSVPGRGSYRVSYDATLANDSGSSTWVGHLTEFGSDFRVVITSGPEGSLGNIMTPSGELELVMTGGQQWLVDRQASGYTSFVPPHSDEAHVPEGFAPGALRAAAGNATPKVAGAGTTTGTGTTTTTSGTTSTFTGPVADVLVYYTPGFAQARGSQWRLRIDQLVALANQAYVDSGVNLRLRLVGTELANYPDTTYNTTALPLFYGSDAASGFGTVGSMRNTRGADLVMLIRPFKYSAQGGSCGVGYVLGSATYPISLYSPYAYSVVSDGTDTSAGYYCTDYTFAHELGHNMGSMHDRATVAAQGGGVGAYPYGFGYGMSGTFGTIMSYISPRIGKFSNPAISTCGGKYACGVSETNTTSSANNALSLNNTAPSVANFKAKVVPDTVSVAGVVSKAGLPVAAVAFTASGTSPSGTAASCSASGSNGAWACTVPIDWTGTITPTATGTSFTPTSISFTGLFTSQVNQNFTKN